MLLLCAFESPLSYKTVPAPQREPCPLDSHGGKGDFGSASASRARHPDHPSAPMLP